MQAKNNKSYNHVERKQYQQQQPTCLACCTSSRRNGQLEGMQVAEKATEITNTQRQNMHCVLQKNLCKLVGGV